MGFRAGLIAFLVGFLATSAAAQTVSQTRAQVPPGTTMLTNAAGNTNGTVLQVGGYASAMFSITASVAMSGGTIVNFECQANGTFGAVSALLIGTTTVVTTTSTIGDYQINVGSYQTCRTRISAYSAGTVSATGYPSVVAPSTLIITSSAGGGSAVTLATGAVASGAYASGSIASGAVASGAFASGAISDGADVTQGAKTDAKSTATDATSITLMQVFKEISFVTQTPPQTFADAAAFTAGATRYTPVGCLYQSVITNFTDGQAGVVACDSTRDMHVTPYDAAGNALAGQRVKATSLPIAIASDQMGSAGTAAAQVMSVQGVASMTSLFVAGAVASGATDSGNPVKFGGKYNSSPITLTDGQRGDAQLDASGFLKVNVAAGSAANGAASNTGSVVPAQADYDGVNVGGTLRGATAVNPSGTVYAKQIDLASVAGTTQSTGTGAQGAGTPRVTVATDTATVAGSTVALLGAAATAAAVPANAVYPGAQDASGNLIGDVVCTASKIYDTNTSGNIELVAISGSKHVYICGYEMFAGGTVNLSLVAGTGTACASAISGTPSTGSVATPAILTPAWQFTTQTGKVSAYPSHGWLIDAGAGNAVCLKTSAGVAAQVQVFYSQR